jgi:hypothetical protein
MTETPRLKFKGSKILETKEYGLDIAIVSNNKIAVHKREYDGSLSCITEAIKQFHYENQGRYTYDFYIAMHPDIVKAERSMIELINKLYETV